MTTAKRLVGTVAILVFVGTLALRPLLSNPALSAVFRNGSLSPQTLFAVPLLLLTLLLVAVRVRSLTTGSRGSGTAETRTRTANASGGPPSGWGTADQNRTDAGEDTAPATASGSETRADPDTGAGPAPVDPAPLSGQGGTRKRDFEVETEPPDAALSAHLDHLRTELDDEAATDLAGMADVVADAESETVPERCPQPHCNAAWTARTVFGVTNGRYELVDGGDRVRCLECEQVTPLT